MSFGGSGVYVSRAGATVLQSRFGSEGRHSMSTPFCTRANAVLHPPANINFD
jgi:hypothetical protein